MESITEASMKRINEGALNEQVMNKILTWIVEYIVAKPNPTLFSKIFPS